MFASGPLEVRKMSRGNTVKEGISTSPFAARRKIGSRSSKLTGVPPAPGRLPKGRLYSGREREAKNRSLPAGLSKDGPGTEASERETGGAVRPRNTNSPSDIGKGSAHSLSFASEGGVQNKRRVGFARGT